MTKEQVLNLEHLSIAEEKKNIHIHTEDGFFITNYDGKNLKTAFVTNCMYMPIRNEYENMRVITAKEADKIKKDQKALFEKEMAEMRDAHSGAPEAAHDFVNRA